MKFIYSSIFFFLLIGCRYLPCGVSFDLEQIEKTVAEEEITGIYLPDETTRQVTPGYTGGSSAKLELKSDQTFVLSDFPKSTFYFDVSTKNVHQYISASGKWKVYKNENQHKIELEYDFSGVIENYTSTYDLYQKDGRPVILIGIGDPDECNFLRLKKEVNSR